MKQILDIIKALESCPAHIIERENRVHAAVALILEEQPDGLNILFIERSANENDYWSGNIAFPGGRAESGDENLRHTAERETGEELGLDLGKAHYVGRLSDIAPRSLHIIVSCFVYAFDQRPALVPDHREIATAFWFPIREFSNPARRAQVELPIRDRVRKFPALQLLEGKKQPLWGLTYRLLRNLDKAVRRMERSGSLPMKPIM
jgi:8-oxo-dGTP pyrophosphatase MutT (NUDIX family)